MARNGEHHFQYNHINEQEINGMYQQYLVIWKSDYTCTKCWIGVLVFLEGWYYMHLAFQSPRGSCSYNPKCIVYQHMLIHFFKGGGKAK